MGTRDKVSSFASSREANSCLIRDGLSYGDAREIMRMYASHDGWVRSACVNADEVMKLRAERDRLRAVADAATALRAILSVSTGADGAMRGVWLKGDGDHVAVVEALDAALARKEPPR